MMPPNGDAEWLESKRQALWAWANHAEGPYPKALFALILDPRNLRLAWGRVSRNKGRNTSGVDRITARDIEARGVEHFLKDLRRRLSKEIYRPAPVRRVQIPKNGRPNEFRNLGVPTIEDRIVQAMILQIIEPLFEARFRDTSVGFRPGRGVHMGREMLLSKLNEDREFRYVIETDIKACFDRLSHAKLLRQLSRRIEDTQVMNLIKMHLKAGAQEKGRYIRVRCGVPQGSLLSPLLSNVALAQMDEYYGKGSRKNQFWCLRYADDSVILCRGSLSSVREERRNLDRFLKHRLGVKLSGEKTMLTSLTKSGSRVGFVGYDFTRGSSGDFQLEIPEAKITSFLGSLKVRMSSMSYRIDESQMLSQVNSRLLGWGNFYQTTANATEVFFEIDRFIFELVMQWLQNKVLRFNHLSLEGGRLTSDSQHARSWTRRFEIFKLTSLLKINQGRFFDRNCGRNMKLTPTRPHQPFT